ncbi:hypothetical protein [Nostoc sp.]|uniref:hypothetical protein n=1 Tax=Nostoc sp. TaxID=1180 RepID=UPI002FF8B7A1
MNQLEKILNERRENLVDNIQILSDKKIKILEATDLCCTFFNSSILKTESDIKTVDLSNLKDKFLQYSVDEIQKITIQSNAIEASELIPEEFGKVNDIEYIMDEFGKRIDIFDQCFIQSEHNLKMFTFIYHQFFITIIATLDDYFSQLLLLILQAYPEKLNDKILKIEIKFSDVNSILIANDASSLLGLDKDEIIRKAMDEQIKAYVRELMYKKPIEYLTRLVRYLGDRNLIRLEKLIYSEMCLRRNAGIHSGWFGNQDYNLQIKKLIEVDEGDELKFSYNKTNFLGFDIDYFSQSYKISKKIITTLKTYCENNLTKQDTN